MKSKNVKETSEKAAEYVPIKDLKPWAKNPRNNDEAAKRLAPVIERFGFGSPIVARKQNREIIAGHTRLKAAEILGMESVPVRYMDISEREAHLMALADNRLGEAAQWDIPVLQLGMEGYSLEDLELAGWDESDLSDMGRDLVGHDDIVEDEVPEIPDEPVTQAGAIWTLGRHRLLCGDATSDQDVETLMNGEKAQCVFTDPPYGVAIGAKNRMLNSFQRGGRNLDDIKNDQLSPDELKSELKKAFILLRKKIMDEDCSLFVTSPQGGELCMMMMMMMESGLPVRHVLIWKKNQPTFSMGRLDYDYQHEPILLTWGRIHKRPMRGAHRTSVWEIDKPRKSEEHPTMKPVELYANAYLNNSERDDNVADLYSGSGTAFIAAEQLDRRCYGMEISPQYCDVIVKRWENLTGSKAELNDRR